MFHIKICGVRTVQDVAAVQRSAADAIGLNFFPPSVRYLDPANPATRELSQAAGAADLLRVGVFVNADSGLIQRVVDEVGLDVIQLHGDETLADAAEMTQRLSLPLVRAIKLPVGPIPLAMIEAATAGWIDAGYQLLLDADAGIAHGGSGKTLDWNSIRRWVEHRNPPAWTLAGGLHSENVAAAIRTSGASSVDTASGVESARGVKSAELIQRFAGAAAAAR